MRVIRRLLGCFVTGAGRVGLSPLAGRACSGEPGLSCAVGMWTMERS